tara:strand:+ start:1738 stop:2289 length:552 start_codon:yes stop_codon:yes gene_type:complete
MRFAIGNPASFLAALSQNGLNNIENANNFGSSVISNLPIGGLIGAFGGFGSSGQSDDSWLNRVYQRELGRDVGDEGLEYWGNELDQGASRRDVRENIRRSDEAWLNKTYKDLLGRSVGDAGRTYWGDELAGGASRESVIDNIKRSNEYSTYQDSLDAEGANNSIGHKAFNMFAPLGLVGNWYR